MGAEGFGVVLKLMGISDLRDRVCLFKGDEAGQRGVSFSGAVSVLIAFDGVREGTQKEGRVGFADCSWVSYLVKCRGRVGLDSTFSSSIAFLAFDRSSLAFLSISSSSNSNFRFTPFAC